MFCFAHKKCSSRPSVYTIFVGVFEQNIKMLRAYAISILLFATPLAWCGGSLLERTAAVKDPTGVEHIISNADTAEPLILMAAAMPLLEAGQYDKAIFYFYAGQLRARYWPKLQGENSQILTSFLMTIGEQINGVAFRNIPRLLKTIDDVVIWDKRSFSRWAIAMNLDPMDTSLVKRRLKAVEGLGPYKDDLLLRREKLEKHAQNFIAPTVIHRLDQELINRGYSQEQVELSLSDTTFSIPANYVWPYKLNESKDWPLSSRVIWVFLPDFNGFTKDNWRELNENSDVIRVEIKAEKEEKTDFAPLEYFLRSDDAVMRKIEGFDAFISNKHELHPYTPYRSAFAIKGTKALGGNYYIICHEPKTEGEIMRFGRDCRMFLGSENNLRITADFNHKYLALIEFIEKRLSNRLKSWMITRGRN